jgi:adenine-specific DNA glycosylase
MNTLDKTNLIRKKILSWGDENIHDLPWRENQTPYSVLVSEFMLHRTNSKQVVPIYNSFINAYPTLKTFSKEKNDRYILDISGEARRRKEIQAAIANTMDPNYPRQYYYSLIDLAHTICKPHKPNCEVCPLQISCIFHGFNYRS